MTEPRPRLTNTIGSVQQTSVVTDDVSPSRLTARSRMDSSLARLRNTTSGRNERRRGLDQQAEGVQVRRIVRAAVGRRGQLMANDEGEARCLRWSGRCRVVADSRCTDNRWTHPSRGVMHLPAAVVRRADACTCVLRFGATLHRGVRVAELGQGARRHARGENRQRQQHRSTAAEHQVDSAPRVAVKSTSRAAACRHGVEIARVTSRRRTPAPPSVALRTRCPTCRHEPSRSAS
jgi:hypothetical protein